MKQYIATALVRGPEAGQYRHSLQRLQAESKPKAITKVTEELLLKDGDVLENLIVAELLLYDDTYIGIKTEAGDDIEKITKVQP